MKTSASIKMMKTIASAIGMFVLWSAIAQTNTIYLDGFSGSGGPLNGTIPDISATGASWVAGDLFYDNGYAATLVAGSANGQAAWLPLTVYNGRIYTATATFINNQPNWLAFGFLSQYPNNNPATPWTASSWETRHSNSGYLWALNRNNASQPDQQGFVGYRTSNPVFSGDLIDPTGYITVKIVLNTMVESAWTGEIWLNDVLQWSGSAEAVKPGVSGWPGIGGIGFSHERNATANDGAWITHFALTEVPEPGVLALIALGCLVTLGSLRRHN